MYIFKSFNYCFYGRMMSRTLMPETGELENSNTNNTNTSEQPGLLFSMSSTWFVSYDISGSQSICQRWFLIACWMTKENRSECGDPVFPLLTFHQPCFSTGCVLTQQNEEGLLLCSSDAILTLVLILKIEVLMKWESLEKTTEKHIFFFLINPKHNPPKENFVKSIIYRFSEFRLVSGK